MADSVLQRAAATISPLGLGACALASALCPITAPAASSLNALAQAGAQAVCSAASLSAPMPAAALSSGPFALRHPLAAAASPTQRSGLVVLPLKRRVQHSQQLLTRLRAQADGVSKLETFCRAKGRRALGSAGAASAVRQRQRRRPTSPAAQWRSGLKGPRAHTLG